jgi:hypothetical protein
MVKNDKFQDAIDLGVTPEINVTIYIFRSPSY